MSTTITKLSKADTLRQFGIDRCDFVYNCESGIEFTVCARTAEPIAFTTVTPLFNYNDDDKEKLTPVAQSYQTF